MQVFTIVAIVCLGAVSAISASISNEQDGLESLPQELLRHIASQLPLDDHYRFSSASPYSRKLLLNSAVILSTRLLHQFGEQGCLSAALHIEDAPPEVISEVVPKLLRSAKFDDSTVLKALKQAYNVGHCDLVDVLSDYLHTSPSYNDNAAAIFDHACDDVSWLASRPLANLLYMHALPRDTFLRVIASKYRDSGYDSFFNDEAWKSFSRCSNSIMSHVLHLYETLHGAVDFKPIPFGCIASTQIMSIETQNTLETTTSSRCDQCRTLLLGSCEYCLPTFMLLQLVLSPGSEMEFFKSASPAFKSEFLFQACRAGHLDWVKFMVNHDLWNDVRITNPDFIGISKKWAFAREDFYANRVMRFADVLAVGDPAFAAFEMIFHHQMKRLPSKTSRKLCQSLLKSSEYSFRDPMFELHRKIVSDYVATPVKPAP